MRPTLRILAALSAIVAILAWTWPRSGPIAAEPPRAGAGDGRSAALAEARRSCRVADLDAFIVAQQRHVEAPHADGDSWRVLAEAYLERALTRSIRRGMAVGRPVFIEVPGPILEDLDLGAAALDRARAAGDASGESYRIEAALISCRVTGITSALKLDGAVRQALETSSRLDPSNPRLRVAVGCRKLFTPALLGGDPAGARKDLLAAADALPRDERPLLYAAMAAWVEGERETALALAHRAAAANPRNPYAAAVAERLANDEAEPFGRDVETTPR